METLYLFWRKAVPGENLTRSEAAERAALINVSDYEIALDFTRGAETFSSTTTVNFTAVAGKSTFIDAITEKVHSVELNGTTLDPAVVSDGVRIQLDGLAENNVLKVVADARYTNSGEGLHRFVDPVDDEVYLYSQFEVPDSRRMFAVFEQPDLKARFRFSVIAPAYWQVVSNSPTPQPIALDEEKAQWVFEPTAVISSYITAIIAGPYSAQRSQLTSRDGRIIPLGVFCRASLAEYLDAEYIFEKTRQGFTFFENNFNYPYPFEKYDQLFVPEFNAGAMENAGAVTFTEAYVFRSQVTDAMRERRVVTILHELAHMWFGDLVTMRWWNDLWLNESFAEYMSTLATAEATEWKDAWATFASTEKTWAYRQDQLPSTHPIFADIKDLNDVQVNFDGITYAKGASVLKQLVAWVGREKFLAGVTSYFKKHAYSNTELRDLLNELEATSGRDLSEWSQLWLETAGVNTLYPEIETENNGVITSFGIRQTAIEEFPTIRPHRLAIGFYTLRNGSLVREHRVERDIAGSHTLVPELVGMQKPDLILVNDDDLAYAKIRLDSASLATAQEHLGAMNDSLARSLIWGSLWDATRDAEMKPRDFVQVVLNNIANETGSTTLRTALSQLVLTVKSYLAPQHRSSTTEHVATTLWQLANSAVAGSDAQFQFVKFFAAIAESTEHLNLVSALFEGSLILPGLTVDTDLEWDLLGALAANGVVGEAEIAAARTKDNTASGQQSAASALASLPTPEAKEAAWSSLVDTDSASNLIVRATTTGFQRARNDELLEPYIDRYFSVIQKLWDTRSYHIASTLITGLYPDGLANQALRDASQAWLDKKPEPAALRRLVVENLAGVDRALAAQAKDAE